MAFEEMVISFEEYIPLISFIVGMINEDALILLAVLSGHGEFPLWKIFIFGFMGSMIHDSIVYHIAKSKFAYYIKAKFKLKDSRLGKLIEHWHKKSYFMLLFISKFTYPTRTPLLIYLGHKEKKFFRYIKYNASALALWYSIMMPIAWLAGRGFTRLLEIFRGLEKILAVIAIAAIIYYIVKKIDLSFLKRLG